MNSKSNHKGVFIAVRHGYYDEMENLTPGGKEQVRCIAQKIRELNTAGLPLTIICSTAPRAEQSARIIVEELEVPKERTIFDKCLWLDNNHFTKFSDVKKFIEPHFYRDMILLAISHLDLVPNLAAYAAEKMYGRTEIFNDSDYGAGWLIDNNGHHRFP
jgi:phosphohistidine phosphatase SixA